MLGSGTANPAPVREIVYGVMLMVTLKLGSSKAQWLSGRPLIGPYTKLKGKVGKISEFVTSRASKSHCEVPSR